MIRADIADRLEALAAGVHPSTGEALAEARVLKDDAVRLTLLAASVLLRDERHARRTEARPTLEERNRAAGRPLRSHAPWESAEEEALADHLSAGMTVREVAHELQRTPGALVSRLQHLGLLQPSERMLSHEAMAEVARERLEEKKSAELPSS